jgi:glycosyltransferase involved in cell wall biosynthesis
MKAVLNGQTPFIETLVRPKTVNRLSILPPAPPSKSGWPWNVETATPQGEKETWPRITIVIPSFQQGRYLEEAIRSVLLQNYPNLELIVNDGGSSDGSKEILEQYSPHLSHWQSKQDGGQGNAINQGFDRATGEILGWLNSDDLYLPGAFFSVAKAFMARRVDIVYGDALNLFEHEGRALQYWRGFWITRKFLRYGGVFASHATFWRREIHQRIWEDLHCNIDGELWQRLVPGRKLCYLPLPLGVCRIHNEAKSLSDRWREKWREDDERIWARHGKPLRNRIYHQWFRRSQQIFWWFTRKRNRKAKQAVIASCQWPPARWLYSPPP